MTWSKFTKKHFKLFKSSKYLLDDKNPLVKYLKNERMKIINFMNSTSIKIKINKVESIIHTQFINKYIKSNFVDVEHLKKDIINLNYFYEITWDNNLIVINTINEIEQFKRIKVIVYMIEYLKQETKNNKNVRIYLILSSLEKIFPKNTKVMDIRNANSGYNNFMDNIIFIWRKEEFEKVLFHELIHCLDLDKRHDHVDNFINTSGPHLYFEAITDFQGIIYHLIYLSIITHKKIISLLEYELGFIRNQAMILNDIWELGNWNKSPINIIEQKTAAFSYYILKYLIFEYFLKNDFNSSENYEVILENVLENDFKAVPYIKIESSRMTLLQLK